FLLQQFTAKSAAYTASYPDAADFIIVKDDTAIGRLLINESPAELRLVDIALLTSFQRRGIGSAILNALQSEASARQLPLTLSVQFDSPALALYQRHGFRLLPGHDGVYLQLIWEPAP